MRFSSGSNLLIALALTAFLAACHRTPPKYPAHPRLILSGQFLDQTRERCAGSRKALCDSLAEAVRRRLETPIENLEQRAAGELAEKCAFLYLAAGDTALYDPAVACLERALGRWVELEDSESGGFWETVELRRRCAFAYDWLWPGMSDSLRLAFGERIVQAGNLAWQKRYFTPYGGGGYGTLDPVFWPAVSLAESGVNDSLAARWMAWSDSCIHQWRTMQDQVAGDDGGMYSGMAYAAYNYVRTPIFDFEVWKSLTGEDLAENNDYLRYFPVWWLYSTKPNGEWLRIDDAGSVEGEIAPWHFKYLASRYRDPLALWYLQNRAEKSVSTVWDVLWDPSDLGLSPAVPDRSWPLARHFEGLGWVVMRSGWDSLAVHAVFDCGDFYYGHQHPAEGGFVIFRNGSLAINSGRYEWGSEHRPNYMARTIASNTMLVFDPEEKFVTAGGDEEANNGPDGRELSNDGGQRWPKPERTALGQTQGTEWDTGDITAFETNRWYSYVCGDASRAYSSHKLKSFTRQFLHIQPDLFLVYDRVESTRPEYRKYWLLHTVNEPWVRRREATARERGGRLLLRSLFPTDAKLSKVGGRGNEFLVFGRNYPPALTHYNVGPGEQWGGWRIEIAPGKPRTYDTFLTLLQAADRRGHRAPEANAVATEGCQGAEFSLHGLKYRVTFNSSGATGGHVTIRDRAGRVLADQDLTTAVQPQSGTGRP